MGNDGCGELQLELLRCWRLRQDEVVVHVATRQQRLIAALAIKGPSLRSYLVGLLWPEYPNARALESLRVSMHLVSRQIPRLIVNDGAMLSLDNRVEVDLERVRAQTLALSQGGLESDASSTLRTLQNAELLPGWYEDWVVFEQSRLQQDRLRAFTIFAGDSLAHGHPEIAGAAAEAALEIEPLYENAVRLLISAEIQHYNPAGALRAYERYRQKLEQDMGLRPSASVRGLVADVLERERRAGKDRLVPAADAWLDREPLLDHS
ncbi:bacterial transcriptional activator domain-containing protein [Arthrobacter sp. OV608]|uniref:AfsR/SARP family transcriptional regulator n=1 Tax=Arthrobacter sp. OV608 TaxID=1882768 RepID=UPI0008AC78AA|nr:bacterial transcriptional activator domain-containing protein [Arthrobacter sp. OV608]SEQ79169.1 DNA-binding transcriptional activator of the SARP family [Arthrobacter sp. OV608]